MLFGIALLIAIYFMYVLLVKGALWKIILAIFGWFGMYWFLAAQGLTEEAIVIMGHHISWAQAIPSGVVLLAMLYTRDE